MTKPHTPTAPTVESIDQLIATEEAANAAARARFGEIVRELLIKPTDAALRAERDAIVASLSASAAYRDGLHIEREAAMDRRMAAHRDAAVRATATDHRALTAAVDAAIADARALDKAAAAFVEALHTYRAPTADLLPMMGRVLKARHAGAQEGLLNATGHLQPHVARNSAASASALACVVDQLCAALGGSAIKDQVAVSQYTVSRGTTFEVAAKQAAEVLKARLGEVKA